MTPDYDMAARAATRLLLGQRLRSLRVDVTRLQYEQTIYFDTMQQFCSVTRTRLADISGGELLRDGCTFIRQKGARTYYIVLYNRDKNRQRQAFTLAHEVGHILLEHREDGDVQEAEANCFAAQLLAPRVLVCALARGMGGRISAEDLCQHFNLSREAACNRLREASRQAGLPFTHDDQDLLYKCRHLLPSDAEPYISV